jgi:undecaprenyl diphosphate synthase
MSHDAIKYVGLISDGSRRWAHARGLSIRAGHEAAADTLRARLLDAIELGVRELTAYSFSTENWGRSPP